MAKRGQSKYMDHMRAKQPKKILIIDGNRHKEPEKDPALKGVHGKNCNRTACQRSNSAWWWNHSTRSWYCEDCAHDINKACAYDPWWIKNYDHLLLVAPEDAIMLSTEHLGGHHPLPFAVKLPNGDLKYVETVEQALNAVEDYRIDAGLDSDGMPHRWYQDADKIIKNLHAAEVAHEVS